MKWPTEALLAGVLGLGLWGCAPLGEVHPRFEAYGLEKIYILDTRNETTRAIHDVQFGGPLQRWSTGARVFDFPVMVRQSIEAEFSAKGYLTVVQAGGELPAWAAPASAGGDEDPAPPAHGIVRSAIESWSGRTMPPYRIDLTCRIELVHVPSGDVLYSVRFPVRAHSESRAPASTEAIAESVGHAVRRALDGLPGAR